MREITDKNYKEILIDSGKSIIVDFWAEWCGPCRVLGPIMEELSEENQKIEVVKCNVDESHEVTKLFGIRSIPTLIFFKDGGNIWHQVGLCPKSNIQNKIDELYS